MTLYHLFTLFLSRPTNSTSTPWTKSPDILTTKLSSSCLLYAYPTYSDHDHVCPDPEAPPQICRLGSTGWPISLRTWVWLTSIWDVQQAVGLYCSCSAAQARQWNIPNLSQSNPGPREDGSPCTYFIFLWSLLARCLFGEQNRITIFKCQ